MNISLEEPPVARPNVTPGIVGGSATKLHRPVLLRVSASASASFTQSGLSTAFLACTNDEVLSEHLCSRQVRGVVVELNRRAPLSPRCVAALESGARDVPVLICGEIVLSTTYTVLRLARATNAMHAALDSGADVRQELHRMLAGDIPASACHVILRELGARVPERFRGIVVTAILAGTSRFSVRELAHRCDIGVRTLDWRLRSSPCSPRKLLGWIMCLHAAWRLDVLGWTLKRVAAEAGFSDSAAVSDLMQRLAHIRPGALAHRGGFWKLLDDFGRVVDSLPT